MFDALNNYFDKIYVVTLERATDRHQHIRRELEGLRYSFLYGADKNSINAAELAAKKVYDPVLAKKQHIMHKDLTGGEIGCSISHTMLYRDVLTNNYQKVLVLEDDVVIDRNTIGLFPEMIKELPADWQLWYLGFAKNEKAPANARLKKLFYHLLYALGLKRTLNHTVIGNLYPARFSTHLLRSGFHDCTHAYAITNEAAAILLQQQTPVQYTADNLLAFTITNKKLNAFIADPKLINQQYQVNEQPVISYLHQ
jgi:glycosyl transferase family 25